MARSANDSSNIAKKVNTEKDAYLDLVRRLKEWMGEEAFELLDLDRKLRVVYKSKVKALEELLERKRYGRGS